MASDHEVLRLPAACRWLSHNCNRFWCYSPPNVIPVGLEKVANFAGQFNKDYLSVMAANISEDLQRSQRAKPIPWGLEGGYPSIPPGGYG